MAMGPRARQLVALAVAAVAFAAAAVLYSPLEDEAMTHEIIAPREASEMNSPLQTLMTLAPGGLRAPIGAFLWMRVEDLKEKGRFHEMRDLSEWICRFMPRFPGVWSYHAWNMAWNVSVTAHTGAERWRWLESGINLLRDRAIPLNPKSLALYSELGRIFFDKIGQPTDEKHMVYKQRWAERMQHLLAASPYGQTAAVIEAFRPIAAAPIDKSPRRRREGRPNTRGNHRRGLAHDRIPHWDPDDSAIQRDVLERVLEADDNLARYAGLLGAHGVHIDETLLEAYNRFSRDEAVEVARRQRLKLATGVDRALSELINDPAWAGARNKALAFVRAQVLWNDYRMDPAWMLHIMEKYNVPLDWRTAQAHGLYWITFGGNAAGQIIGKDDALNIDRNLLNCLKILTWTGRLTYTENPDDPVSPEIRWSSDWRFIEPTHQAHIEMAHLAIAAEEGVGGKTFATNKYHTGHTNYLSTALKMLYVGGRQEQALHYFQWLKTEYKQTGGLWDLPLDEYVIQDIRRGGNPIPALAQSQIRAAVTAAYEHYAVGDSQRYRSSIGWALRVYRAYQDGSSARLKLPPWPDYLADLVAQMLVNPRTIGTYLDLETRHRIYTSLPARTQAVLYDFVAPALRRQCDLAEPKLDFNKAFPAPPGLEQRRQERWRARAGPAAGP